jgi:hypothetical protein
MTTQVVIFIAAMVGFTCGTVNGVISMPRPIADRMLSFFLCMASYAISLGIVSYFS